MMKIRFFLPFVCAGTLAQATLLFQDSFSAINANDVVSNDGTPSVSLGTNLSYAGLESSGSSLNVGVFQTNSFDADTTRSNTTDFTSSSPLVGTNPVIYFSALLQVPDVSVFGNNGGSAYVGFDSTVSNTANYGLGLQVSGAGVITFGADRGTGTVDLGGSVAEGETVLVVGRITDWQNFGVPATYEYTLNPNLALDESSQIWGSVTAAGNISPDTVASDSYLEVNAFSVLWNDDNNAAFLIDEHRVGTTWGDVTPAAIPEPSTLALSGLTFLGMWILVRKRVG